MTQTKESIERLLTRAFDESLRRVRDEGSAAAATSLPEMITLNDGQQAQVFVKIALFDEDLLARQPLTGGLLCNESLDLF